MQSVWLTISKTLVAKCDFECHNLIKLLDSSCIWYCKMNINLISSVCHQIPAVKISVMPLHCCIIIKRAKSTYTLSTDYNGQSLKNFFFFKSSSFISGTFSQQNRVATLISNYFSTDVWGNQRSVEWRDDDETCV